MTSDSITYELQIQITAKPEASDATRELVKAFLIANDEPCFVEGVVDGLDIPFDYEKGEEQPYEQLFDANPSPLSIYKADKPPLTRLKGLLEQEFQGAISCEILQMSAASWQEGWKDSFERFSIGDVAVHPPWQPGFEDKINLEIEPGMAFGTGQHQTTQLCLDALQKIIALRPNPSQQTLLDLGCGSGILAICAAKLGVTDITAADIDVDGIKSSEENAERNQISSIRFVHGSIDAVTGPYSIIVANILSHVLAKLLPGIAANLAPGGHLLMSGILAEDAGTINDQAEQLGLKHIQTYNQDDWIATVLVKG